MNYFGVLLFAAFVLSSTAAEGLKIKLTGIIADQNRAMFEVPKEDEWGFPIFISLCPGEEMKLQQGTIEVTDVTPAKGLVRLKLNQQERTLTLKNPHSGTTCPNVNLQAISLDQLESFYSDASKRTILRPTALSGVRFHVQIASSQTDKIISDIEKACGDKGITFKKHGEKFSFVLLARDLSRLPALLALEGKNIPNGRADYDFNFPSMPIEQVAMQYADLTQKSYGGKNVRPTTMIHLRTAQKLTRDEARFALEAVMALNRVKITPVGNNAFKLETGFLGE